MIDKVKKDSCVGCKSCGDICPKKAIDFKTDNEGFWYPFIIEDKCIKCNLCDKVCPSLSKYIDIKSKEPKVYAAYSLDRNIRYKSTSGGMYYEIAKSFIENGGYIAGCVYNDDLSGAHHTLSNKIEDLSKIMGSKYFQSDTRGIFTQIKKIIKDNKVLFCGAPCQVAALNNYIGNNDNLYTIDFICRGINSPLAYRKFIEDLEIQYQSKVTKVHFKNKSHGWLNLGTYVEFANGKKYFRNRYTDPWVTSFIEGDLSMRPSCHNCKFKEFPRVADISIGDFWGRKFTYQEGKLGVSVVLVNSVKGEKLLEYSKSRLYLEDATLKEACDGNPALLNRCKPGKFREEFFRRLENEPYSKVVWDLVGRSFWKRIYKSFIGNLDTNLHLIKNTILEITKR